MARGVLRRCGRVALTALILAPAAWANAEVEEPGFCAALEPVSDGELAQLRGGLRFHGLDFDVRVFVRERVNGVEVQSSVFELARGERDRLELIRNVNFKWDDAFKESPAPAAAPVVTPNPAAPLAALPSTTVVAPAPPVVTAPPVVAEVLPPVVVETLIPAVTDGASLPTEIGEVTTSLPNLPPAVTEPVTAPAAAAPDTTLADVPQEATASDITVHGFVFNGLVFQATNTADNASVQFDAAVQLSVNNAKELFATTPVTSAAALSSELLIDAQTRAVLP